MSGEDTEHYATLFQLDKSFGWMKEDIIVRHGLHF